MPLVEYHNNGQFDWQVLELFYVITGTARFYALDRYSNLGSSSLRLKVGGAQ